MKYVALYGHGSDECVKSGFVPLPVHFYTPIPDLADLDDRNVWTRKSELAGIEFQPSAQVLYLSQLGAKFGNECRFPEEPSGDESEFHLANSNFSFGCAASLHCMIRDRRPRRIIEVGSGNSSKVIARALALNERDGCGPTHYCIIDPYPSRFTAERLHHVSQVVRRRAELVEPACFDVLHANDILFIDSGHTTRIGGDVNFLFLDILPRLAPGVIVHVHDVNLPFEYEREYVAGQPNTFRRLWTESYLLQAFLACNREFEVLLAMRYLMMEHRADFNRAFPRDRAADAGPLSSSFWIRRVTGPESAKAFK